ncbi:MAG TPA: acyl-CoA dehydrogenase family protein [Alphaproteobacteria bacterium]|nr:acyl-CoA dehydrogenase family protein [Alphaproteobacteria bacterium]
MNFLLTDDQRNLQASVEEFAREKIAPVAEQLDREATFPTSLFHQLAEIGVTRIPFEEKWGGMGLGTFETALALEQVARADQSLAVTTMVSIATGLTLARFGTDAQKEKYLPDIVAGKKICSIAGTEPNAGSDTAGFKTRGRVADGKWVINGEKAYITNPGTDISSFALVLVVTSPPDAAKKSFTLFLVPVGTPGYKQGAPYKKMGWRSSDTRPLYFEDCVLGPEHVVGEVDRGRLLLHKGYQQARVFLATCSLGLAQASLDLAVGYAKERQAFGGPIGKLQLVQKMIADIAVKVETARMVVYKAAWLADQGKASGKDLAVAKYYATEIGSECANLAIQVHGGWGFMDDCPASRYLRDNRVCTIGDGSSQIQSLLIARELGLDVSFS